MALEINWGEIAEVFMNPLPPKQPPGLTPKEKAKLAKWSAAKSGRLIRKAADIMSDKGHNHGQLRANDGSFCIRGAVNYAWSGNAFLTYNYEYFDQVGIQIHNVARRNPEVVQALTDFRAWLFKNGMIATEQTGVEWFNDKNNKDEVIRWMRKYADEVDPQK